MTGRQTFVLDTRAEDQAWHILSRHVKREGLDSDLPRAVTACGRIFHGYLTANRLPGRSCQDCAPLGTSS